jgi:NAD-dependent deacetylase
MSTESGIRDFRGPSGIWTKDPEAERRAHQTYDRFLDDPIEYWKERLTGSSLLGDLSTIEPNPGHLALVRMEALGVLKAVITQNIDGLHRKAGSRNVLDYHGNAFRLRCFDCGTRCDAEEYDTGTLLKQDQLPPVCRECGGILKSDVVHFKEPIPHDVARRSLKEAWSCDVMLVCGTSAAVYPFAQLPRVARERIVDHERQMESGLYVSEKKTATTIIEINTEPTPLTREGISDYLIRGRTGEILPTIAEQLAVSH